MSNHVNYRGATMGLPHQRALRGVVVGFATLVNNIRIPRFDNAGNIMQWIHVPIGLADKVAWYRMLKEKGDKERTPLTALSLPRISLDLSECAPDIGRQRNPSAKLRAHDKTRDVLYEVQAPAAWMGKIKLDIIGAANVDCFSIIEQIAPKFRPAQVVRVNVLPDLGISTDIPFTLEGSVRNHQIESDFSKIEVKSYTMTFDVRFEIYGQVHVNKSTLKSVTDLHVQPDPLGPMTDDSMFAQAIWRQMNPWDPTLSGYMVDMTPDNNMTPEKPAGSQP